MARVGAPSPVAICLVTYDSADDLDGCFAAIAAQDHRPLEVVVVDCASADDSVGAARRGELPVEIPKTIAPLAENRGFAGGMNEALRRTDAPYVLTLNADARPAPDFVRRLVERAERPAFDEHGAALEVGAVTGRLMRPPGADGAARLDACGMYLVAAWRHLDRGSGEVDRGQYDAAERVFGGTGAATLWRRAALDDVAFVDAGFAAERFSAPREEIFAEPFHSFREDAELCFRLQERGWEVLYEPAAVAEHRRSVLPERRRDLPAFVNLQSLKNRYLLRAWHQTPRNALRLLIPSLLRDLAALAWVLAVERTSLPAYGWLWRRRRDILARRAALAARRTAPPEAVERWFRHRALPLGGAPNVLSPETP